MSALPIRRRLPDRRRSLTLTVWHGGQTFATSISQYPDGRLAELFIRAAKTGSDVEAIAHDAAIIISVCLQHGIAIADLLHSIKLDNNGMPSSLIGAALTAAATAAESER